MSNRSYNMMHSKPNVNRNKLFLLNGIVASMDIKSDYTNLTVLVTNYYKSTTYEESYKVFAFGEAKRFADEYVKQECVVDIMGEFTTSKKEETKGQIVLLARYIHTFVPSDYDEDIPEYIDPNELTDEDLAF